MVTHTETTTHTPSLVLSKFSSQIRRLSPLSTNSWTFEGGGGDGSYRLVKGQKQQYHNSRGSYSPEDRSPHITGGRRWSSGGGHNKTPHHRQQQPPEITFQTPDYPALGLRLQKNGKYTFETQHPAREERKHSRVSIHDFVRPRSHPNHNDHESTFLPTPDFGKERESWWMSTPSGANFAGPAPTPASVDPELPTSLTSKEASEEIGKGGALVGRAGKAVVVSGGVRMVQVRGGSSPRNSGLGGLGAVGLGVVGVGKGVRLSTLGLPGRDEGKERKSWPRSKREEQEEQEGGECAPGPTIPMGPGQRARSR